MGGGGAWSRCRPLSLSSQLPQDKEPRGIIPLENLSIREVEDSKKPVSAAGRVGAAGWVQLFTERDGAEATEARQRRTGVPWTRCSGQS